MKWRIPRPPCPSSPLPSLFQSLSTPKTLAETARIHQQLIVHGLLLSDSTFLTTKLLQLYADADHLPSALHLFDALPHPPSIFAWTPILALHSRSARHLLCLRLYSLMRSSAVAPDTYALPVALRSSPSAHPSLPSALHVDAIRFALLQSPSLHVACALLCAYSATGDVASASRLFDLTPNPNLRLWNSIISAYASIGSVDSATRLLDSMTVEPDTVTWNTVMSAYCNARRCGEAAEILRRVPHPNAVSFTTVILGFSRCGDHETAIQLFRSMLLHGGVAPDEDMLSSVVSSCRHVATAGAAVRELHAYGAKAIRPAAFYGNAGAALVAAYAAGGRVAAAARVFRLMDPADAVAWNALIVGLVHAGMGGLALEQFKEMRSRGVECDATTLATALPACDLKEGKQVHARVLRVNYGNATPVFNALISAYSRSGCIAAARSVFDEMRGNARDVVTWNAMIAGYASHGLGRPALELLHEMALLGVRPNSITITSALTACSHCGMVEEGLELFEKSGLAPTMEQYACVVDLLSRAGRFGEAVGFIERMPVRPEGSVWGALLAASQVHHEGVEFARLAFDQLVQLEPGNAGNYVTMSGIYARAGRWEEAKMVRKMMESRGVVKPSGYSWLEVAKK